MHGSSGRSPADLLKRYRENPGEFRSDVDEFLAPLDPHIRRPIYKGMEVAVQRVDVNMFTDYLNFAAAMIEEGIRL
jgi:hypothetical protein